MIAAHYRNQIKPN